MKIAISMRVDFIADRGETRDALDRRLIRFASAIGGVGFAVANAPESVAEFLAALKPGAVILSGGNDIGASADRDKTETALVEYAIKRGLPILGICRGMQFLASYFGAKLAPIANHAGTRHRVSGEIDREVNSYHNFAIAELGGDWRILARSEDGAIEAIRHKKLAIAGLMWHPERDEPFNSEDLAFAKELLCKNS